MPRGSVTCGVGLSPTHAMIRPGTADRGRATRCPRAFLLVSGGPARCGPIASGWRCRRRSSQRSRGRARAGGVPGGARAAWCPRSRTVSAPGRVVVAGMARGRRRAPLQARLARPGRAGASAPAARDPRSARRRLEPSSRRNRWEMAAVASDDHLRAALPGVGLNRSADGCVEALPATANSTTVHLGRAVFELRRGGPIKQTHNRSQSDAPAHADRSSAIAGGLRAGVARKLGPGFLSSPWRRFLTSSSTRPTRSALRSDETPNR
jgi:hypothetical protein